MEEYHSQTFPLAHFNKYQKSDEETATTRALQKERTNKCFVYVFTGIVATCTVVLIFALIVLRVQTPGFKLRSATVTNLSFSNSSSSPSFNVTVVAEISIKNSNFGRFKFENGTMSLIYRDKVISEREIGLVRIKKRGMKRMKISMGVNSNGLLLDSEKLSSDINLGILSLRSYGKLNGRVNLINIVKKRKPSEMNCIMDLHLKTEKIQDLVCK